MANKIQFKRGLKAELPVLADGEPGFCKDSKEFYIGNGSGGNTRIPTETDYIRQPGYADTAGTANTYRVTLSPALSAYTSGVALAVKINAANTGAATLNVNGLGEKNILNSKGAALAAGKLVVGGVYTLRYNGTAFILQGEGGDYGTATAAEVLAGRTVGTENGLVTGTMPNNPKSLTPAGNLYPSQGNLHVAIPKGAYLNVQPGSGYPEIDVADANFIQENIRGDKVVFGLQGNIPIKNGEYPADNRFTWNPGTPYENRIYVKPPKGLYPGGTGDWTGAGNTWVSDPNFISENIRSDKKIFGLQGGMPVQADYTYPMSVAGIPGAAYVRIPQGAYVNNGGSGYPEIIAQDPNFIASNIRTGVNVFGLNGTLIEGKRWAKVAGPDALQVQSSLQIPVNGLNFIPTLVFVLYSGSFSIYDTGQGGSGCAINNIVTTSFLAGTNSAEIDANISNANGSSCIINIHNKRNSRFYISGPGSIYLFE